jgi:hypothetical protein
MRILGIIGTGLRSIHIPTLTYSSEYEKRGKIISVISILPTCIHHTGKLYDKKNRIYRFVVCK